MEKLTKIIEAKAMAKFFAESNTFEKRKEFMLKHACLGEFVHFVNTEKALSGATLVENYKKQTIGAAISNGIAEDFIKKVLYPRMKDTYIEMVVAELESKLEPTIKITIEKS